MIEKFLIWLRNIWVNFPAIRYVWACESCKQKSAIWYGPVIDPVGIEWKIKKAHAEKSPKCRGEARLV